MSTRFFKNVKHICGDIVYYIFYPISRVAISRYKRKLKKINKRIAQEQIATEQKIENNNIQSAVVISPIEEQLRKMECYKIFKERENCSYFDEDDNRK